MRLRGRYFDFSLVTPKDQPGCLGLPVHWEAMVRTVASAKSDCSITWASIVKSALGNGSGVAAAPLAGFSAPLPRTVMTAAGIAGSITAARPSRWGIRCVKDIESVEDPSSSRPRCSARNRLAASSRPAVGSRPVIRRIASAARSRSSAMSARSRASASERARVSIQSPLMRNSDCIGVVVVLRWAQLL